MVILKDQRSTSCLRLNTGSFIWVCEHTSANMLSGVIYPLILPINITVELRREVAFKTVRYVKSLVSRGLFDGCGFYRAEPPGPTIDAGKLESRKGYALVQGGLYSCGRQENKDLPLETKLDNSKGTVALITGTSEFFFSLEDHYEWNGSFSVFGTMIGEPSWRTLEELVALPTRQEAHPSGTVMRILVKPVIFKATIERHFYPPSVGLHSS